MTFFGVPSDFDHNSRHLTPTTLNCGATDKGAFQRLHQHFVNDPDMEWLIIDATIIRAHPCAAGALKTSGG